MDKSAIIYEIRVQGSQDDRWNGWFEGMTITSDQAGETVLSGQVVDQAALHGLLEQILDLKLKLISVRQFPIEKK